MNRPYVLIPLLAWVLWIRTEGPNADDWNGVSGFETRERCLAEMKEKMDTWRQFKDTKFTKNSVIFLENNTTFTYSCLPDIEDPRPKGKPRK
jgi:hypothetical protein